MKRFLFLIISILISITLTSGVQKSTAREKTIILQPSVKNIGSDVLKQSAEIISSRLKMSGMNTFEVKLSADKGQLNIVVPDNVVISEIEGLLTLKGELAFFETYTQKEIADLLKPDNQIFKLLTREPGGKQSDPRVGCANGESFMKAEDYLKSASPVKNCKLYWGRESEKTGHCLFALKTDNNGRPLLLRSDVESVKIIPGKDTQDNKIQIRLKPAAISIFAEATKNNLNKSIVIAIDDHVYSWPVVKSPIEGGEIEVTGSFTAKEVTYFPAIFNSEQLPVSFIILK
jgi:preprotein translocase subunit SecD